MFFCPYFNEMFRTSNETSYVRILHAVPDAPAVDVYINNKLIARGLKFKQFTEYMPIAPGDYKVKLFKTGTTVDAVIDDELIVADNSISTVTAIGAVEDIQLQGVADMPMPIVPGRAMLKFVHFSPNAPALTLQLRDDKVLFRDVDYREVTGYAQLMPGTYDFNIKSSGIDKSLLIIPNITLKPNRFYTMYTVGLLKDRPPLQVLIPLDGNSYLRR